VFSSTARRAELDADKTRFQPDGSPVVSVAMHLVNTPKGPLPANASRFSDRLAGSPVGKSATVAVKSALAFAAPLPHTSLFNGLSGSGLVVAGRGLMTYPALCRVPDYAEFRG